MLNTTKYKGLVSQGFDYHHGYIKIEKTYNSNMEGFTGLSLDYGYTMKKFFYDMQYIKDFTEEFDNEILNKIINLKKRDLCLDLEKKWTNIGKESVFNTDLGVAKLYEEPLKEYLDDTSFITFSKEYYLKEGFSFSNINKDQDMSKQPSNKRYFKSLYDTHKKDSLLIALEEAIGANEETLSKAPNLQGIYYVNSSNKNKPQIYRLEMETTLFQMRYLQRECEISNIYFQFDGMLLQHTNSEYNGWNITYSTITENFFQEGIWFIPYIGDPSELIKIGD